MKSLKFIFFILIAFLASCMEQKSQNKIKNNIVEVEVEEMKFPPQTVLQLKSYYLSSAVHTDSADFLIGYNYRLHSLDYMNLQSKEVTQTILSDEGPDAVISLTGLYANSLDSIWMSDESERVFLLDNAGQIKTTVNLKEYLQDTEQLLINTNHAMFTSHLYYNEIRQSLMFLVKKMASQTFVVRELFLDKGKDAIDYELEPSRIIPDITSGYAFINAPNVNFTTTDIIYNYPFESSVYTLDIQTGERKYVPAQSQYTENIVERVEPGTDYSTIEKCRIQNPHFFDVMYIPKLKKYVRLHLGGVDFDEKRGRDELMNDRILYLMIFDEKMKVLGESKLLEHRYNNFTGWSVSYNGVALFVDNILDEEDDTEDLAIDVILFP
ncbi:MAG: DUF4221 family protein [Bacteroides uniformis]|uniref:DUF4221 domain-containing protein n=3 Tax=Bacteroidia TaxID=200643 RepID=R9HR10_BACUN|nr:hypothetical protein C801_03346 [Bacteroides uniformis dnLKV2]MBS6305267.1 DUF4221 family protein [Bacteroides uniformis]RJV03956.1 DUF4221 domain-containing protein [Bacteroides sp. AF34-31BH]